MRGAVGLIRCSGVSSAESSPVQFGLSLECDGAEAPLLSDTQVSERGSETGRAHGDSGRSPLLQARPCRWGSGWVL